VDDKQGGDFADKTPDAWVSGLVVVKGQRNRRAADAMRPCHNCRRCALAAASHGPLDVKAAPTSFGLEAARWGLEFLRLLPPHQTCKPGSKRHEAQAVMSRKQAPRRLAKAQPGVLLGSQALETPLLRQFRRKDLDLICFSCGCRESGVGWNFSRNGPACPKTVQ
jgi:hypothetical protein